jgi:uncharacterized NAD(P)/FAD-binding protein YdhS
MRLDCDFVIVGGGFSGCAVAIQLLRHSEPGTSIVLFEPNHSLGRGAAYGTDCPQHLLNVPASNMSALSESPDHFLLWAQQNISFSLKGSEFLPRFLYGRYVSELLFAEVHAARDKSFRWENRRVISIEPQPDALTVIHDSGTFAARKVVLALGNHPPPDPDPLGDIPPANYASYAWAPNSVEGIPKAGHVLLLGSGLTSIDVILALEHKGFRGTFHVLSRHGLLPNVHRAHANWGESWTCSLPNTARALLRAVRKQVQLASKWKIGWLAVLDSMRSSTTRLWLSLPIQEKKRFLRHLRCYWDIHRHRMAPEVNDFLQALVGQSRLNIYAGCIVNSRRANAQVEIAFRRRGTNENLTLTVDRIINCSGSETDPRKLDEPLLRDLLARGMARPHSLLLGLEVDLDGAVIDQSGRASSNLFAVGPLLKGVHWETTAVPEIRLQAYRLAQRLTKRADYIKQIDTPDFEIGLRKTAGAGS